MKNKKIIFMGTPDIAAQHLNTLIENNLKIVGVFTQPPRKKNRGMRIVESEVHKILNKCGFKLREKNIGEWISESSKYINSGNEIWVKQ